MIVECTYCGQEFKTDIDTDLCDGCHQRISEGENEIDMLNDLYKYGDDGFCDGFART